MTDYNKLSIINARELNWIPPHFVTYELSALESWKKPSIAEWIMSSLTCRFCITSTTVINDKNKLTTRYVVALEDNVDLTYFALSCKYLRRT